MRRIASVSVLAVLATVLGLVLLRGQRFAREGDAPAPTAKEAREAGAATLERLRAGAAERARTEPPDDAGRSSVPADAAAPAIAVVDRASGAAVAGAELTLDFEGVLQRLVTAADGRARWAGAAPRSVEVRHGEYFLRRLDAAGWAALVAAGEAELVVIELDPVGRLRVRVSDERGEPVRGAYVRVEPWDEARLRALPAPYGWNDYLMPGLPPMPAREGSPQVRAGTDAAGELEIGNLPCGPALRVEVSWRVEATERVLRIDPSLRVAELELRARRTGVIAGRVLWDDGSPAGEVLLRLRPSPGLAELRATAADGGFEWSGVPDGRYFLAAQGQEERGLLFDARGPRTLVPDLVLVRLVRLAGRVVLAAEGVPLEDAAHERLFLRIEPAGGGFRERVRIEAGGRFEAQVPAGELRLAVERLPTSGDPLVLGAFHAIAPAEELELRLDASLALLECRFDGLADGSAEVHLLRPSSDGSWYDLSATVVRRGIPIEDGRLALAGCPPGRWDLLVDLGAAGSAFAPGVELRATAGTDLGHLSYGAGSAAGIIEGPAGELEVVIASPARAAQRVRVAAGAFVADALPAGPYLAAPDLPGGGLDAAARFEVVPGARARIAPLAVPASGGAEIAVTLDGEPSAGERLDLYALRLDRTIPGASGWRHATTDAAGRATFRPLLPGGYRLILKERRARPEAVLRVLEVAEGATSELRLELTSRRTRLRFWMDGAELRDVERVRVVQERSGESVLCSSDAGELRAPLVGGTALFLVASTSERARSLAGRGVLLAAAGIPSDPPEELDVHLGGGALTVLPSGQARWVDEPRLGARAVQGFLLDPAGRPQPLLGFLAGEGARFPWLPDASRLELEIALEGGRALRHELATSGAGERLLRVP